MIESTIQLTAYSVTATYDKLSKETLEHLRRKEYHVFEKLEKLNRAALVAGNNAVFNVCVTLYLRIIAILEEQKNES